MSEQAIIPLQSALPGIPTDVAFQDLQSALAGDLARLSSEGKVKFYAKLCEFTGLNPLSKPFDWITFQGKVTLYPNKGCAEQLRALHRISFDDDFQRKIESGCIICTVRVTSPDGRRDWATAAIPFDEKMSPDAKAMAIMKVETKAKRRATFSICGLTMFVRGDGEDDDEVRQVHAKVSAVTSTESSTDRAAMLGSVVETTEVISGPATVGTTGERAASQPPTPAPVSEPIAPAPVVTPDAKPDATETPPAKRDGISEDMARNVEIAITSGVTQEQARLAFEYLLFKGSLPKGSNAGQLNLLKPEAANWCIKNPARLHARAAEWEKRGRK
jgi:hypothetical protein